MFNVIEIRNDLKLTSTMTADEKIKYIECLQNVARFSAKEEYIGTVGFARNGARELRKRFELISSNSRSKVVASFFAF